MNKWKELPEKVRKMVVGNLDVVSRTKLRACSKADKRLCDTMPYVKTVIFNEFAFESPCLNVIITFMVTRKKEDMGKPFYLKNYFEAWDWLKKYMKGSLSDEMYDVHDFFVRQIGMNLSPQTVVTAHKLDIKVISYKIWDIKRLLDCLVEGLDRVKIHINYTRPNRKLINIGEFPALINARIISIENETDINDRQLLDLKFHKLYIFKPSKITTFGINLVIRKWIKEDYPIGSRMLIRKSKAFSEFARIFDGIKMKEYIHPRQMNVPRFFYRMENNKKLVVETFHEFHLVYIRY